MARILADRMRSTLKQPVLVENVTGAGGSIGVTRAVRSAPDGYTISFGHLGTHVFNGAIYRLTFDLLADLEPVAMLPSNPMVVVSKNDLPAKTLKEFVAWAKRNSGKISAGTAGAGSGSHIGGVYFENVAGVKLQFVPYRGTGPALNDLMAGQIDVMIDQTSNSINQIRSGKIRAYAVTDQKRVPTADDIPTVDEAGLPGFYMTLWSGMWVPKGSPKPVIAKLNTAVIEALADPSVSERFAQLGLEVPPRARQTPEALAAHHKAEIDKWWPIIKAGNIRAD
jgi:tripartite-type tricarboxylate transporter receptor subunit TctC